MKTLSIRIILLLAVTLCFLCGAPVTTTAASSSRNEDYRIAPRDNIVFQVHTQPDTVTHQRVTANGELQLPLVGRIKVAGQTVREAEALLEQRLREGGYFVAPQVILSVEQYRERYISVLGQVKNPDRVEFSAEVVSMGILHAVARVGGFTRIARTDAVQILRTSADGTPQRFTINLDEFLKFKAGSQASPEFQLLANDVVFVPERAF